MKTAIYLRTLVVTVLFFGLLSPTAAGGETLKVPLSFAAAPEDGYYRIPWSRTRERTLRNLPDDAVLPEEPVVSVLDAANLPTQVKRRVHDGADDRVQAGGVASSGVDGYSADFRAHGRASGSEDGRPG